MTKTPETLGRDLALSYVDIFNAPGFRGENFTPEKFISHMLPRFIQQQIHLNHLDVDSPEKIKRAVAAGCEAAEGKIFADVADVPRP